MEDGSTNNKNQHNRQRRWPKNLETGRGRRTLGRKARKVKSIKFNCSNINAFLFEKLRQWSIEAF